MSGNSALRIRSFRRWIGSGSGYGTAARKKDITCGADCTLYFIWNPDVHHESPDFEWRKTRRDSEQMEPLGEQMHPANGREHEDLLSEFESLMAGAQATLEATGMQSRRMTDQEMFLEVKRALNPTDDRRPAL
jgi:hypothetical protein